MLKNSFTLLELIIVTAIMAILISILLPSLTKTKYISRSAVCASNIKQNIFAISSYALKNNQRFPSKMGGSPEFNRYFYQKKKDRYFLLGQLWQEEYLASYETIFCPEVMVNYQGSIYTQSAYMINGEFNPRQACINEGIGTARSNYITYPYNKGDWSKIFLSQLENTEMLHADAIFNKYSGEKFYNHMFEGKAGWNVMRVDGSLKFVQSSSTQVFVAIHDLFNNWPDTETARDDLLSQF